MRNICSPYEFRKCLSSDIEFVTEFELKVNNKIKEIHEQKEHNQKIQDAMHSLDKRW